MSERGSGLPSRRLSLLFVNQHYWPDVAATGQILADLAEYLAARGHSVSVLCSRGGQYVSGTDTTPLREARNGVDIRRVRTTSFGRDSHPGRIADYASFYVQLLAILLRRSRFDAVVFLTTPPLLSFSGWLARLATRQPYGVWSMDLHPDAEVAAGMLDARSPVARFLEWANARGLRSASFVVALGAYMQQRIVGKGVSPERTHVIPVWGHGDETVPAPREENPLRRKLGLDDRFVVMYSGNAGKVHDFDGILDAMRILRDDPGVYFLFVGDGPQRRRIEDFAREHHLRNFQYREYFPRDQLQHSLTLGDAHLISLREPFVGISVPSKLYGIMAAGRPAIFVGPARCESADAVRDADAGAVIDPADGNTGENIVRTIRCWAAAPERVAAMGVRARAAFEREYDRERNCARFEALLRRTTPG